MGQAFGQHGAQKKKNERDRLLFIAAAGLAFSLLVIMLVVLNLQSDASAKDPGLGNMSAELSPPAVGTVTLYVLDRPARAGQKLAEIPLKEVFWPRNQVPEGALRDRAEFKEQYAKIDLPAGIPLQREHLTAQPALATLPVTPGNRAVTIEVDATSGLEGLALPGTRVDVVLTYMKDGQLTSKIIVQNAIVLSSGGDTTAVSNKEDVGKRVSTPARTVTLDVSTRDALEISTARQLGRLGLTMRAGGDNNLAPDLEVNADQVGGGTLKKKPVEKVVSSTCTRGHYRINGKEFQLNCDGTSIQVQDPD